MKNFLFILFLFFLCLSANAFNFEYETCIRSGVIYAISCETYSHKPIGDCAFVIGVDSISTISIPKTITYFNCSGKNEEREVCLTKNSFRDCNFLNTIFVANGVWFVKEMDCFPEKYPPTDSRCWGLIKDVFDKCKSLCHLKLNGNYSTGIKVKEYSDDRYYKLLRCFPTYDGKNKSFLDDVNEIDKYAFQNCEKIDSIIIPYNVKIGSYAFNNCKNLRYADFNPSKCGYAAFQGTNISKIIVDDFAPYDSTSNDKIIINIGYKRISGGGAKVYNLRYDNIYINDSTSTISKTTFYIDNKTLPLLGIKIDSVYYNECWYIPNDSVLSIKNSFKGSYIYFYTKILNRNFCLEYEVKRRPNCILNVLNTTQSTATFSVNAEETEDAIIESITPFYWHFQYDYKSPINNQSTCTISQLPWGANIRIGVAITYKNIEGSWEKFVDTQTQPLSFEVSRKITPTSIHATPYFGKGDANIGKIDYLLDNIEYETSDLYVNNLSLNSTHSLICRVYDKYSTYKQSIKYTIVLPAPELTTIKEANSISNTTAVICANTNLDDVETTAGFEWRRYDAPELVPSSKANCPIIDGVMMGALKNLSTNTYYKFRPYYTAKDGTEYYGDWSAFGTADAYVYFDPTVRTYNVSNIGDNHVTVKGYAIAGSDPIIEQGFEYWESSSDSYSVKKILSETNKHIVKAEGQWMTANIDNLIEGKNYAIRAFVRTSKETTYGEIQTFTTTNTTGIGNVFGENEIMNLRIISQSYNTITVNLTGMQSEGIYQVFNLNGLKVCNGVLNATNAIQQIQTPNLSAGIYLLKVSDNKQSKVVRVIIR